MPAHRRRPTAAWTTAPLRPRMNDRRTLRWLVGPRRSAAALRQLPYFHSVEANVSNGLQQHATALQVARRVDRDLVATLGIQNGQIRFQSRRVAVEVLAP